jgi:hypothetical protein
MNRVGQALRCGCESRTICRSVVFTAAFATAASLGTGCVPIMSFHAMAPVQSTDEALLSSDTARTSNAEQRAGVAENRAGEVQTWDPSDTVWTIERGSYSGMTVPLRLEAAIGRTRRGEHFWRLPPRGATETGVVGWRSTRYPVPVAFRHGGSAGAISPSDSAAFWNVLDRMSVDFGMQLFRSVTVRRDADPSEVIMVDVRSMADKVGFTRMSWSQLGELFDVRVTFRESRLLHDAHIVSHEMMHALGFGHTGAWPSVVSSSATSFPGRVSPEDVAYAEAAMRSREKQEATDMRHMIALAVSREPRLVADGPGYALCDPVAEDSFAGEPMINPRLLPVGVLMVVAACGGEALAWPSRDPGRL